MNIRTTTDNNTLISTPRYFDLSIESLQFYVTFLIASISTFVGMTNTRYSQAARDYSHIWAPSLTTLGINSMSIFFSKKRENREYDHKEQTLNLSDMNSLMQKAEAAFNEHNYLLACENYKCCIEIYKKNYPNKNLILNKKLYFDIVYKTALSEFKLNLFENALSTIMLVINDKCNVADKKLVAYVSLINLKAIIHYKSTLFEKNNNESFNLANAAFKESFAINPTQNDVFLFIMYFAKEYDFIANNIPHKAFNPNIDLILTDNLVENYLFELCGIACIAGYEKQQNIELGLCLLQLHLNNINPNPISFLEMINTHYLCIRIFDQLLQKESPKISFYQINEEINTAKDEQITKIIIDKISLVTNLIAHLEKLKSLMIACKHIPSTTLHPNKKIVIENTYEALASLSKTIRIDKQLNIDTSDNINSCLDLISDMFDLKVNNDLLISNEDKDKNTEDKQSYCSIF